MVTETDVAPLPLLVTLSVGIGKSSDMAARKTSAAETRRDTGTAHWSPMAFGNPDGSVVECWACTLPVNFTEQLAADLDGLRQQAANQISRSNGRLIDADKEMVDGRPAFRRVVHLGVGAFPIAAYVAELVVPLSRGIGLQVTVTCGALGGLPHTPGQHPVPSHGATRSTKKDGAHPPTPGGNNARVPRPGLAEARRKAGHNQETLAAVLGVDKQTVSSWETGSKEPRETRRSRYAEELGISLAELDRLIRGEPLMPPGATVAGGPGSATWIIDVDKLPRRLYPDVPIPAATHMLRTTTGVDGLSWARQILDEVAPAIRITPVPPA
jgi:DNA-binding XRE family transcriptional regulator